MNIKIIENWRIKSDRNNVMLVREQEGKELIEGYYDTLEGCLMAFLDKKIRLSNASSVSDLLRYIKQLQTALNHTLRPLKLKVVSENEPSRERQEKDEQT